MKHLSPETVRSIADSSRNGELDEVIGAVTGLSRDALAELKALTWLGKDGESVRHWDALVIEARFRIDDETARLLAEDPALAAGLEKALDALESAGRI